MYSVCMYHIDSAKVNGNVEKQRRVFVDNLKFALRMTRASSRNIGKLYTEH